jgi:hypothetical protein
MIINLFDVLLELFRVVSQTVNEVNCHYGGADYCRNTEATEE